MPTNYTSLTDGQYATAAVFNAPLTELDDAIENIVDGSKALSAPDITSFANSTHTHQDAANGGSLDAAAIGSGTLSNSRVNWASPSAIGSTTPAAGTFSALTVSATAPSAYITGTAGNARSLFYQSGGTNRFVCFVDSVTESGSNAGSNFQIGAYSDAGSFLNNYVSITRSSGNVNFTGTLSKGGGSFDIDHPLDPDNRDLIHSFVEAPRADLIYRGKVRLTRGQAVVNIDTASDMTPGTFEALTKHTEADIFLQNVNGWEAVRGELVGNVLTITTQNQRLADNDTISWMVVAERNDAFYRASSLTDDQGRFIVERDKPGLTPAEEALLDKEDAAPEALAALIGKRGFAKHAHLTGRPMPRPRPRHGKGG